MKKRAVFLDRDGTINVDVGYPNDYNQIDIYPYSFEAIKKLNKAGLLVVIITNQSGVGRGLIRESDLQSIHQKMKEVFASHHAYIDGIYYCPHYVSSTHPAYGKDCTCRKPRPGMAFQAATELEIDLKSSYMVGDKVEDILFGRNIGASPLLVLTGYGQKSLSELREKNIEPAHVAPTLKEAVEWILEKEKDSIRGESGPAFE
ncbi:MAG: D-glycero-beta-D-manno-heptose 1,7-bisphosphate 7-phosphatase [Candidatus Aminicenantales bacterium]